MNLPESRARLDPTTDNRLKNRVTLEIEFLLEFIFLYPLFVVLSFPDSIAATSVNADFCSIYPMGKKRYAIESWKSVENN